MKRNNFAQKIAQLYPWLLSKAFYLCRNKEDAEDLAMDVVCKMLENSDKFNANLPIKPWAVIILSNIFYT